MIGYTNESVHHRMKRVGLIVVIALLIPAGRLPALINPSYTPVDLVYQSDTIIALRLIVPDDTGRIRMAQADPIRGENPADLELTAPASSFGDALGVGEAFGGLKQSHAIMFTGSFSDASMVGGAGGPDEPVGAILIGTNWFALQHESDRRFVLAEDPFDLRAVWAGGSEMLERLVRHAIDDPRATVPTKVGVRWKDVSPVAKIAGQAGHCSVVFPGNPPKPLLVVASGTGDRLFDISHADRQVVDVTDEFGLTTRSRHACWGDFNGDGMLDLASSDGESITFVMTEKDAGFSPPGPVVPIDAEVVSLCSAPSRQNKTKAGVVVGTEHGVVHVELDGTGKFAMGELEHTGVQEDVMAGPCIAADFDDDGRCDVLQVSSKGAQFYKGTNGGFASGRPTCQRPLTSNPRTARAGDFDADGSLDVVVGGEDGIVLLSNDGNARFTVVNYQTGELAYIAKPNIMDASACDINADGRQDLALFYSDMGPQIFFNRGFRCFGYAVELDMGDAGIKSLPSVMKGQKGGTIADLNADGIQEMIVLSADGELAVLWTEPVRPATLSVSVVLPASIVAPVKVTGYDGKRCLGARLVTPGAAALFGKVNKGPLLLEWRDADGTERSHRSIVLKPMTVELPLNPK